MFDNAIPVVDLFAGPGGLGEGFSAFRCEKNHSRFRIGVSIEMDKEAHKTLLTRAFYRNLAKKKHRFYYDALKTGNFESISVLAEEHSDAHIRSAIAAARNEALCLKLGEAGHENEIKKAIDAVVPKDGNWVLIGGPPCQAYSIAGRSRNKGIIGYTIEKDHRSSLYKEYLRVIARWRPAIFVMENVKGMGSAKVDGNPILGKILNDLRNPVSGSGIGMYGERNQEYQITPVAVSDPNCKHSTDLFGNHDLHNERDFIVRCEQYGIPQHRHRLILLGIRADVLKGNHAWQDGSWRLEKKDGLVPTVDDAIADLPPLTSYLSSRKCDLGKKRNALGTWDELRQFLLEAAGVGHVTTTDHWTARFASLGEAQAEVVKLVVQSAHKFKQRKYRGGAQFINNDHGRFNARIPYLSNWYHDPALKGICNHNSRSHMDRDLERYLFAACFAKIMGKSALLEDFPSDLQPDHKSALKGNNKDRFRVQINDKPANTITSHISKDGHHFIHPDPSQCRSLTVREAARIQTFPDNYVFCGPRTSQFVQVGNAVPPFLALQLAGCVWKLLASRS